MLCYFMLWYVILCLVMLKSCYFMVCYAMLYCVMLCYVILWYVMLCYSQVLNKRGEEGGWKSSNIIKIVGRGCWNNQGGGLEMVL